MKISMKIAAFTALSITASQALAFETEIDRAGMLYLSIPLNTHSVPTIDKSVMGFRFGQTRTSTDNVGSLFSYFRKRPALFDVQFGFVGRKNSPDDIHFGLLDLKLTGISSIEKTYINGQAVVGAVVISKLALGAAAVGGIAVAAAASGEDDSDDDSSSDSSSSKDDDQDDDKNDDVAENESENENEEEHEDEHEDEAENEAENEDDHEEGHDDDELAEHEDDDDQLEGTS
jgi:hypothetical protein